LRSFAPPFVSRSFVGAPKLRLVTSERVDWAACFVSLIMLLVAQWALAQGLGGVSTIVLGMFIAPWLLVAANRPSRAIHSLLANWPVLTLPLFALASAAWSGYPSTTTKAAAEYLLTTAIAVIAASCVKPRTLISAFLIASSAVVAVSAFINVSQATNVGLFGSKNYFGLSVALLLPTGWAVAIDRRQPPIFRLVGALSMICAPLLLVQSGSTGALICSAATVAATCAILMLSRLTPIARFAIAAIFAALVVLLALAWLYAGDFSELLNAVGKDTTLTGRTYLWGAALTSIQNHPILGVGYQAYWQIGSWGAEELWQISYVTNKTGYHFHDSYLEVAVDLGLAGLSIFLLTFLVIIVRMARNIVFQEISPEKLFAIYLIILLLLRSPIEVDLFWQFQTPTIIFCMAWIYLGQPATSSRHQKIQAAPSFRARRVFGDWATDDRRTQ
jgi:exopolysaccharide production protein ExoQ